MQPEGKQGLTPVVHTRDPELIKKFDAAAGRALGG
jgi:hypothetical protein